MNIKCIAVDDEPLALQLISEYVSRFPSLNLIQTFEDAIAAAEFLRHNTIDLLFIDINMPDINGIELVKALENKPMIIFTTAYKNFAFEGFELEAIDYLLKPIDIKRFTKAIEKALDFYKYKHAADEDTQQESLYVYAEYKMVKVNLNEVEYIESMEDYIKIHTGGPKPVMTLMPLKKVLEKLPPDSFKRIHRSYIINVNKIKSIQNRKVQLDTIQLPVSDTYIDNLRSQIRK
ncbi:LytR/AlgR family response regulator transcription factor [Mucilaginibacter sp. KACC 22063]|uniref:LytR/AlgR family response regulator transcription factor n=1 Tax=Mucilaginibacter sp. KACC 22063 TaxID=3025666 RepID=UPI002366A991|nr:LytTR family DNA-binding domain-containing protein [Mucilaginibacter sp. KACC 22063]WDF54190.1 LytTR family DNA-binding domain-containing protein [Mucilaginibacter sp. KACC 22063]